jgi:putative aldouronate transport system substrate-binding protein
MKAALGRMAEWYKKGYISPEFVVVDGNQKGEAISSGDWLFYYGYWWSIATFCNTWTNVPESDVSAVPFLTSGEGTGNVMKDAWYTGVRAITTSCANPEAAVYQLNEYWDSYYRNDTTLRDELSKLGYTFKYPITEPKEPLNADEVKANYPNVAEPKLLWKYDYDKAVEGPGFMNDYYTHGNLILGLNGRLCTPANNDYASISAAIKGGWDTSLLTTEAKSTLEGWYASNPKMLSTFATSYDIWKDLPIKVNKFCASDTPTMIEKKAYLDKLELECFTKIIMGTQPLDSFDQFVTDWKQNGGDQITQEVNAWYQSTK